MNGFDTSIISGLNHLAHHSRTFDSSVVFLVDHDLFKGGVFMALIWWAWFQHGRGETHRRDYLVSGLATAIVAVALARVLVHALPFRERPLHTAGFDFVLPYTMRPDITEGWSSFPSDHAVLFFALATSLFFVWRPLGIFGFLYALVFISLPRLYLGIHWPTDVIAGAALGIALGWLGTLPRVRSMISRPAFALLDAQPGLFYGALFLITYETATLFTDARETASFARHTLTRLI